MQWRKVKQGRGTGSVERKQFVYFYKVDRKGLTEKVISE